MVFGQTPVVHVGLGKTGTTSLQQLVFPLIPNFRNEVVYNAPKVIKSLRNLLQVNPQPREENEFRAAIDNGRHRHFISLEALTGWNPATWEERADRNLRLFGSHARIIITARPTEEWLRSVYQQKVHEGNVISPESFFLREEEYDRMESFLAPKVLSRFNVDSFDLERLYNLYCDRFESVFLVPFYQLERLDFLGNIFGLTEDKLAPLRRVLAGGRLHNRAYSSTAMALTFQREKLLGVFGLASRGSNEDAIHRSLTSAREINEGLLTPPPPLHRRHKYRTVRGRFRSRP